MGKYLSIPEELMMLTEDSKVKEALDWCMSVMGACQLVSGDTRFHGRTAVCRLRTPSGYCYVKIYRQKSSWEREVHAYEQWVSAFANAAPRLLAVRDEEPFSLLVGELPGRIMENVKLPAQQEQMVWHDAGRALVSLHDFAIGECFGPCRRDGACAGTPINDAMEYILAELERWTAHGIRAGYLNDDELAIIRATHGLLPSFENERPVPCHRDYCPANWLVTSDGVWAGVIDFEFANWDVRVADFCRYPDFEWLRRPDLWEAFLDGYGRFLTTQEEQQRLVAHVQYAISAVVWGCEHSYHGFAEEGRQALVHLGKLLR